MYKGQLIDQLIESVQAAERNAIEVRVTRARRPQSGPLVADTYIYEFTHSEALGVA